MSVFVSSIQTLAILTVPLLIVCSFISYPNIQNSENSDFHSKWGSLFLEFKNNKGYFSTQFYTIYVMRRLSYIFSQVYLNSNLYLQAFLNTGCSLMQLTYMVYYLPYKEKLIMTQALLGEICTTFVMILSILFINQPSESTQASLSIVIMIIVLISMIGQSLISLTMGIISIINICKKIQRWNAKAFLKNARKIHQTPVSDDTNNPTSPDLSFHVDYNMKSFKGNLD